MTIRCWKPVHTWFSLITSQQDWSSSLWHSNISLQRRLTHTAFHSAVFTWIMLYHNDLIFVIFTARQRSCGKVMLSVVSVCLFTRGCHVTIIHDALPPPPSAIWCPRLQTCSNLFTCRLPPPSWHLVGTVRILLEYFLDTFDLCSCWEFP